VTSKLSDLFRDTYVSPPEGVMGLEFECESDTNLPNINSGTWRSKTDGSLRANAGLEYVTHKPLPFDQVHSAIERLLAKVDTQEYMPLRDSRNTSWHVHLNALHFTPVEYMTRIFTWWMIEPIMLMHCAPHRRQNLYCLQVRDAGAQLNSVNEEMFIRFATRPNEVLGMVDMHRRYCAQNITALGKYGSVEYRCMDGTLDVERIKKWTTYLHNLWYANPFENPDHLFDVEYEHGVGSVLERLNIDLTQHLVPEVSEQSKENTLGLAYVAEQMPYDTWDVWQRRIDRAHISRPLRPSVQSLEQVAIRGNTLTMQVVDDLFDDEEEVAPPAPTYAPPRYMTGHWDLDLSGRPVWRATN
jgi:hypothetical protein